MRQSSGLFSAIGAFRYRCHSVCSLEEPDMAVNKPIGDSARKGAVKNARSARASSWARPLDQTQQGNGRVHGREETQEKVQGRAPRSKEFPTCRWPCAGGGFFIAFGFSASSRQRPRPLFGAVISSPSGPSVRMDLPHVSMQLVVDRRSRDRGMSKRNTELVKVAHHIACRVNAVHRCALMIVDQQISSLPVTIWPQSHSKVSSS